MIDLPPHLVPQCVIDAAAGDGDDRTMSWYDNYIDSVGAEVTLEDMGLRPAIWYKP